MGELESNALVLGKGKKERKEHWNRDTHIRESCANGASILGTSHLLPADWNGMKRNCRGRGREGTERFGCPVPRGLWREDVTDGVADKVSEAGETESAVVTRHRS